MEEACMRRGSGKKRTPRVGVVETTAMIGKRETEYLECLDEAETHHGERGMGEGFYLTFERGGRGSGERGALLKKRNYWEIAVGRHRGKSALREIINGGARL